MDREEHEVHNMIDCAIGDIYVNAYHGAKYVVIDFGRSPGYFTLLVVSEAKQSCTAYVHVDPYNQAIILRDSVGSTFDAYHAWVSASLKKVGRPLTGS
jgi:hypothetical protein